MGFHTRAQVALVRGDGVHEMGFEVPVRGAQVVGWLVLFVRMDGAKIQSSHERSHPVGVSRHL